MMYREKYEEFESKVDRGLTRLAALRYSAAALLAVLLVLVVAFFVF